MHLLEAALVRCALAGPGRRYREPMTLYGEMPICYMEILSERE